MRKMVLVAMCALLTVGLVLANAENSKDSGKSHKVTGEVVSVDVAAKTITVKDDKGESHTATVMGHALETLKNVKAGEKVVLTCHDNEKGEHEGVTHIEIVKG